MITSSIASHDLPSPVRVVMGQPTHPNFLRLCETTGASGEKPSRLSSNESAAEIAAAEPSAAIALDLIINPVADCARYQTSHGTHCLPGLWHGPRCREDAGLSCIRNAVAQGPQRYQKSQDQGRNDDKAAANLESHSKTARARWIARKHPPHTRRAQHAKSVEDDERRRIVERWDWSPR
jgi:hypothetical protein